MPLTHGYRHYRLQPSPPHNNISDAQVPGEDPPLVAQLAPLSTEEILTRLKKARREDDVSPPSKRRKTQAKGAKNKTLAHILASLPAECAAGPASRSGLNQPTKMNKSQSTHGV